MKKVKRKQGNDNNVTAVFDENLTALSGTGAFKEIGITQETSIKEQGLEGETDSRIVQYCENKFQKFIFITGDNEKGKKRMDFVPSKKVCIIQMGGKVAQFTSKKKQNMIERLTKNGLKDISAYLGRKIYLSESGFKQKFYKTGSTTKLRKWKIKT